MSNSCHFNLILCKTALNVDTTNKIFYASINPYLGCQHQCRYCYVQAEKYSKGRDVFSTQIKYNIIDVLIKELAHYTRIYQQGIIYLGTSSDPYQPAEKEYNLTHKILSLIFNHTPYNIHIFTKSKDVEKDIDLFKKFKNRINISITIITIDKKIKEIFEPNSCSIEERLECIRKLNMENIAAGCAMMPVLPYITDNDEHLEKLFIQLKKHNCKYIWWGYLTLRNNITNISQYSQKEKYLEIVSNYNPDLVKKYLYLYKNRTLPQIKYQKVIDKTIINFARKYNLPYHGPQWNLGRNKIYQQLFDF